jgi:D-inositol-3-phosphate glycosyltransferase
MQQLQRIAILSVHTSPLAPLGGKKTGGMNVYVREVVRFLGKRGVQVDVFTREDDPSRRGMIRDIAEGARLIYLPAGPPEFMESAAIYPHLPEFRNALLTFIRDNAVTYDVVYSHYWLSGWVAMALRDAFGVPFIQMFHTLGRMKDRIADSEKAANGTRISMQEQNMRVAVEAEIINEANLLVAATPAERLQLMWLYRADRRKIEIVPPGVDLAHFFPIPAAEARAALGLQPEEHMLLFVGRIEPLKGVETILRALALLHTEHPAVLGNLKLYIVGGDLNDPVPEIERLQALCRELRLEDHIVFSGAQGHDALPLYYNATEALVMPSDYESFGMVALEAMACGTPVIASEVGGLAFLIRDYETGLHVPVRDPQMLANSIRTLITDPEQQQQMGARASAVAQHYAWDTIVDRLLALFVDVS